MIWVTIYYTIYWWIVVLAMLLFILERTANLYQLLAEDVEYIDEEQGESQD